MKNRSAGRNHRDKYLISDILSRNRDDVIDFSRSFFIHTWYEYLSENLNKTEIRNLEKKCNFSNLSIENTFSKVQERLELYQSRIMEKEFYDQWKF